MAGSCHLTNPRNRRIKASLNTRTPATVAWVGEGEMTAQTPAKTGKKSVEEIVEYDDFDPTMGWDDLTEHADEIVGADLAKEATLDALAGVPFVIHRVTFRRGIPKMRGGEKYDAAMCTFEVVIAPEHVLRKRRVDVDNLPFEPGGSVVFNDGSTGMYRQAVAYLATKGFISLPEGPTSGGMGESVYDLAPADWTDIHAGDVETTEDGYLNYRANIRLKCPRGIRVSTYETDYNPDGGQTRYFA